MRDIQQCDINHVAFRASGDPHVDVEMIQFLGKHLRPGTHIICDANEGGLVREALRVSASIRDFEVLFV